MLQDGAPTAALGAADDLLSPQHDVARIASAKTKKLRSSAPERLVPRRAEETPRFRQCGDDPFVNPFVDL